LTKETLKIINFFLEVTEDDRQSAEEKRKHKGSICRKGLTVYSQ